MYGGQATHIPLKVNQAGVIPVIFAISLLQFPITITYFTKTNTGFRPDVQEINQKNWTQVQVSEMIDVQQGTYSRWENGTLEPSLEVIVKLAKLFDTTTD